MVQDHHPVLMPTMAGGGRRRPSRFIPLPVELPHRRRQVFGLAVVQPLQGLLLHLCRLGQRLCSVAGLDPPLPDRLLQGRTGWSFQRHDLDRVPDQPGANIQHFRRLPLAETIRQFCRMVRLVPVVGAPAVSPGPGFPGQVVGDESPLGGIVGDNSCEWASWFKAQFDGKSWTRAERIGHTDLLKRKSRELRDQGYEVTREAQNHFTVNARTLKVAVAGKCDLTARQGDLLSCGRWPSALFILEKILFVPEKISGFSGLLAVVGDLLREARRAGRRGAPRPGRRPAGHAMQIPISGD